MAAAADSRVREVGSHRNLARIIRPAHPDCRLDNLFHGGVSRVPQTPWPARSGPNGNVKRTVKPLVQTPNPELVEGSPWVCSAQLRLRLGASLRLRRRKAARPRSGRFDGPTTRRGPR